MTPTNEEQMAQVPPGSEPMGGADVSGNVPGIEDMSPEQINEIKRIGLAAQTILASEPHNEQIVQLASRGDGGMIEAVITILSAINERRPLSKEMIPVAAVVILLVLADFMTQAKLMQPDPNLVGRLLAKLLTRVMVQYKLPKDEIRKMIGGAPSEQRKGMNAEVARSGLLGKMMQRV